jgi:hypothetical protein
MPSIFCERPLETDRADSRDSKIAATTSATFKELVRAIQRTCGVRPLIQIFAVEGEICRNPGKLCNMFPKSKSSVPQVKKFQRVSLVAPSVWQSDSTNQLLKARIRAQRIEMRLNFERH